MSKVFMSKVILLIFVMGSVCYGAYKASSSHSDAPGALLINAMRLGYESNGEKSSPWVVVSAEKGISIDGMQNCTKIEIVYEPGAPGESRSECPEGKFLMVNYGKGWLKSRPIVENVTFEKKTKKGDLETRYTTKLFSEIVVGNLHYSGLETEVISYNSDGTLKGRLIEHYSIGLSTALRGTFQIPDASDITGWQTVNDFSLVEVK